MTFSTLLFNRVIITCRKKFKAIGAKLNGWWRFLWKLNTAYLGLYLKLYKLYKLYKSNPIQICFVLLLLCNEFVLGCCICTCTLYVFVFVLYMYLYLYLRYICICICPGGPKSPYLGAQRAPIWGPKGPPFGGQKGPHLVAKGHQPSTGARSLAPIGGQTF